MTIPIISYAYGNAANNPGCADGPKVLEKSSFLNHADLDWCCTFDSKSPARGLLALPTVAQLNMALAKTTQEFCRQSQRFLALGGDHSMAIGTWSGVSTALQPQGFMGLIWIDAHLDSHNFETTPSNNIHGMPLAALLGYGDPSLTQILSPHNKITADNVVVIGVRNYEQEEYQLLHKLGVKIFMMEDIQKIGLAEAFQQALAIVTKNTVSFGISFDLDAIDPNDAPGVGCRETGGIDGENFLRTLPILLQHRKLKALEISEFNPHLDVDHKTEKLIAHVIQSYCV